MLDSTVDGVLGSEGRSNMVSEKIDIAVTLPRDLEALLGRAQSEHKDETTLL